MPPRLPSKSLLGYHIYCPQQSWGKVMFFQASVILLTGGVCLSACWDTTHPPEQTPPLGADTLLEQTLPPRSRHPPRADPPSRHPPRGRYPPPREQSMLGDTVNARAVRILLECNLVMGIMLLYVFDGHGHV